MFDVQSRSKFVLSLHDTGMKLANKNEHFIPIENLNELIPEGMNGNKMSFWYYVKKNMEKYITNGVNSKLKVTSVLCINSP